MLTYNGWLDKFPQFVAISEPQWIEMQIEAASEMGSDPERWVGQTTYDIAQGY